MGMRFSSRQSISYNQRAFQHSGNAKIRELGREGKAAPKLTENTLCFKNLPWLCLMNPANSLTPARIKSFGVAYEKVSNSAI